MIVKPILTYGADTRAEIYKTRCMMRPTEMNLLKSKNKNRQRAKLTVTEECGITDGIYSKKGEEVGFRMWKEQIKIVRDLRPLGSNLENLRRDRSAAGEYRKNLLK